VKEQDHELVGEALLDARWEHGWSLNELCRRTGLKNQTISRIERGLNRRAPRKSTQAKLEEVLGIKLPFPNDPPRIISVYIAPEDTGYLQKVRDAFPGMSQSQAIMSALKAWYKHYILLKKWNEEHDVDLKKDIERITKKHHHYEYGDRKSSIRGG